MLSVLALINLPHPWPDLSNTVVWFQCSRLRGTYQSNLSQSTHLAIFGWSNRQMSRHKNVCHLKDIYTIFINFCFFHYYYYKPVYILCIFPFCEWHVVYLTRFRVDNAGTLESCKEFERHRTLDFVCYTRKFH